MGRGIRRLFLIFVFVFSTLAIAWAAAQNAVVYGTVYDVNGKPLAGITVLLENPALGLARVTISSADGSYSIAEIPPAQGYRLTALRAGKKVDLREGLAVNVGDERVILPPLREQSPVTAVAEPVARQIAPGVANETVTATLSGVITGEQLRTLPLYNRNFLALGLLTPNTHDVEAGSALEGASFSIAGARPNSNNFLLDGSDNVASSSNQAIPFQVNDSIQEFRVISSLASAEYGRNLGGVVNVVTRRATTGLHGGLFGYFANDVLNANQPLSVYKGSGFDLAASDAGGKTIQQISLAPSNYNDYALLGGFLGYCTDSLSPTQTAGTHACPMTGGYGKNSLFDPAAILATNDSRVRPFDSKQFGANLEARPSGTASSSSAAMKTPASTTPIRFSNAYPLPSTAPTIRCWRPISPPPRPTSSLPAARTISSPRKSSRCTRRPR